MMSRGQRRTEFMQREAQVENKLRLWIAAQKLDAQSRLREVQVMPRHARTDEQELEAANMTGRLAVLGQVDAMLAGEVGIPEADVPTNAEYIGYQKTHISTGAQSRVRDCFDGRVCWEYAAPERGEQTGVEDTLADASKRITEANIAYYEKQECSSGDEPDSRDEAIHRQDCDMPVSYSTRHANGAHSEVWVGDDGRLRWSYEFEGEMHVGDADSLAEADNQVVEAHEATVAQDTQQDEPPAEPKTVTLHGADSGTAYTFRSIERVFTSSPYATTVCGETDTCTTRIAVTESVAKVTELARAAWGAEWDCEGAVPRLEQEPTVTLLSLVGGIEWSRIDRMEARQKPEVRLWLFGRRRDSRGEWRETYDGLPCPLDAVEATRIIREVWPDWSCPGAEPPAVVLHRADTGEALRFSIIDSAAWSSVNGYTWVTGTAEVWNGWGVEETESKVAALCAAAGVPCCEEPEVDAEEEEVVPCGSMPPWVDFNDERGKLRKRVAEAEVELDAVSKERDNVRCLHGLCVVRRIGIKQERDILSERLRDAEALAEHWQMHDDVTRQERNDALEDLRDAKARINDLETQMRIRAEVEGVESAQPDGEDEALLREWIEELECYLQSARNHLLTQGDALQKHINQQEQEMGQLAQARVQGKALRDGMEASLEYWKERYHTTKEGLSEAEAELDAVSKERDVWKARVEVECGTCGYQQRDEYNALHRTAECRCIAGQDMARQLEQECGPSKYQIWFDALERAAEAQREADAPTGADDSPE